MRGDHPAWDVLDAVVDRAERVASRVSRHRLPDASPADVDRILREYAETNGDGALATLDRHGCVVAYHVPGQPVIRDGKRYMTSGHSGILGVPRDRAHRPSWLWRAAYRLRFGIGSGWGDVK